MTRALRRSDRRGMTLIEVVVALGLGAVVLAGVLQALLAAYRAHRTAHNWARAVQLAEERMERVRSGDQGTDPGPLGLFTRSWTATPALGYADLSRVRVTVVWYDGAPRSFTLSALLRTS